MRRARLAMTICRSRRGACRNRIRLHTGHPNSGRAGSALAMMAALWGNAIRLRRRGCEWVLPLREHPEDASADLTFKRLCRLILGERLITTQAGPVVAAAFRL